MLLWAFAINVRERNPVGPKRQKHLTDALHLGKTGENQPDRLVYAQIRIHFYFLAAHFHVANRYRKKEFSPPRFLLQSFHGTGAQERQFEFAHRALHTQQQPIVWTRVASPTVRRDGNLWASDENRNYLAMRFRKGLVKHIRQIMLMNPTDSLAAREMFKKSIHMTIDVSESVVLVSGLRTVKTLVDGNRIFEALKAVRSLFPIEAEILAGGKVSSPTQAA